EHAATLAQQIDLHRAVAADASGLTQPSPADADTLSAPGGNTGLPCVPGYEILAELGRGGMGAVFKAKQLALERLVALNGILAGEFAAAAERERFRAEALAVARLQHANVVQVFEVGEHHGHPYLALEFVDGGSLADALAAGPLPPGEAAALVEALARAVQYAH